MSVFADSSAVVKLYADEPDSHAMRGLDDALVVSQLTRVEVPSALWRKSRTGALTTTQAAVLVADFESHWFGSDVAGRRYDVSAPTEAVCEAAARLVAVHGLRAYDAVQLATATRVRDVHPETRTFAVFDVDLRAAAAAEGFMLLP